jgi:hypothetical protein
MHSIIDNILTTHNTTAKANTTFIFENGTKVFIRYIPITEKKSNTFGG